jgi:hypothetical protein
MKCMVKLHRPYDRSPGDHKYGQRFDELLDLFIGGSAKWEKRSDASDGPVAEASDPRIRVELHETGPEFAFFIENAGEIATYVSALATLVSSWISVRLAYQKPRDPVWESDGTIIQLGDLKITAGRDLTADEILSIAKSLFAHARETRGGGTGESVGGDRGESVGGGRGESVGGDRGESVGGDRGESVGGGRGETKGHPWPAAPGSER